MPRIDIPFIVEKQHITQPTREVLISGGRNYFYATFIIDEIWANIPSLKAVFVRDDVNKLVDLTETESGYECEIPWEVIVDKGILHVGIFGGDRLLTNYAYVVVKQGCVTEGEVPKPPTEDWFIKIEGEIEEIRENGGGGGGIAEETDPTVPEWAKQPTKPSYTAEEVGALPSDTPIVKDEDVVHKFNDEGISGVKAFYDGIITPKIIADGFELEAGGSIYFKTWTSANFSAPEGMFVNQKKVAMETEIKTYLDEQTEIIKLDVEGLQKQLNEEAHFKGYLSTNAKIQALQATPNDFAYSAESGTKWVYDAENGWQDTGTPVPDQLTPASNETPLVNGEASAGQSEEYARGDHRHPTDTTRVSVEAFNEFKTSLETAFDRIIAIQNSLIGGDSV